MTFILVPYKEAFVLSNFFSAAWQSYNEPSSKKKKTTKTFEKSVPCKSVFSTLTKNLKENEDNIETTSPVA